MVWLRTGTIVFRASKWLGCNFIYIFHQNLVENCTHADIYRLYEKRLCVSNVQQYYARTLVKIDYNCSQFISRSMFPMYKCIRSTNFAYLITYRYYGVRRINEVTLRRARLVLGLVRPLTGLPSRYLSRPTQPGHPSVGRCNEFRRWFRPLGRNSASEVTTLWRFINQFIDLNKYIFMVMPIWNLTQWTLV